MGVGAEAAAAPPPPLSPRMPKNAPATPQGGGAAELSSELSAKLLSRRRRDGRQSSIFQQIPSGFRDS